MHLFKYKVIACTIKALTSEMQAPVVTELFDIEVILNIKFYKIMVGDLENLGSIFDRKKDRLNQLVDTRVSIKNPS